MPYGTEHFIQEAVKVEDADATMVYGRNDIIKPISVKRLVLLSIAADEITAVANMVAQDLGMTVHSLDDASSECLEAACALDHAIIIPKPMVARQDGVLAALSQDGRVFFNMVNPVRIAVALGLSGDEGETFCREAMHFEDMSLGMSHMILPDGTSLEEIKVNILESLGHFSR
ncbi:MAG: hypothetical protein R3Y11_01930 [Pseudomonadota bacterium]